MSYSTHINELSLSRSLLMKESSEAERNARMTRAQLDYIYRNELFHLLVPKKFGGEEMDLPSFAKLMESYAEVDGALAWVINLGAGANMFAGFMDEEAARTIFSNKKTCVAGSGAATGTAESEADGFLISGKWKYASGSAHANWFSLNAKIDGDGNYQSFLVPREDVEVLDTWHVYGMKATSSCDFKVEKVWIPAKYKFDLQNVSNKIDTPLYRFPFNVLAEINMVVMVTGLAIGFTKRVLEYANVRSIEVSEYDRLNRLFMESRSKMFAFLEELWTRTVERLPLEENLNKRFSMAVNQTAQLSRELVDHLYAYTGMSTVFEANEISRVYRDFKVASQHGLLFPRHNV